MNLEAINKWLDEEYGCSYTRLEELHDFLIEQNMKYQDKIDNLQQENKQLKSILTDLEEWCNDGIKDEWVKFDYGTEIIGIPIKIHITSYEMVLDKMKELQGSDSNEI